MKWEGNRQSDNVEDARDGGGGGGGGPGFRLGGGRGVGLGGARQPPAAQAPAGPPPADDTMARFVSTVLADTQIARE